MTTDIPPSDWPVWKVTMCRGPYRLIRAPSATAAMEFACVGFPGPLAKRTEHALCVELADDQYPEMCELATNVEFHPAEMSRLVEWGAK